MRLDEESIRQDIIEYRDANEADCSGILERFRKRIELYLYHFPKWAFRKDGDWCSGFYLYMVERLAGVVSNFPLDSEVSFKTWFNAVLRNRFLDYAKIVRKTRLNEISFEEMCEEAPAAEFEEPGALRELLPQAISRLKLDDRLAIRLFYFPESLTPEELRSCAENSSRSMCQMLEIQRDLISARLAEVDALRAAAAKVSEISEKLSEARVRLAELKRRGAEHAELAGLLSRIARLDASRWKHLRALSAPEREVMKVFERCFRKPAIARGRLDLARKRLKFEWARLAGQTVGEVHGVVLPGMV